MSKNFHDDIWYMELALEEADKAYRLGEVPVGAVIVDSSGKVVSSGHNEKEIRFDATSHAEINAIRKASLLNENWRLSGHTLYVTLEPCVMCAGAIVASRLNRLVFGAFDPKGGAFSLGYNYHNDARLNHQFKVTGGLEHFRCSRVMSSFFRERRSAHKK